MSYDINFRAKLEGMDKWVYVGDRWLNITGNAGNVIKAVCGSYPSKWGGTKCSEMYPVLMQGASLLNILPSQYRPLIPQNSFCTVEGIRDFLERVADVCDKYPAAVLEVEY